MKLIWFAQIKNQKTDSTCREKRELIEIIKYLFSMLGIIFNVINFQEMVYLTLNAKVDSSTAKNLPGVYLSLKLF